MLPPELGCAGLDLIRRYALLSAARRIPVRYAKAAAPLDRPKRRAMREERREQREERREKREERIKGTKEKREETEKREFKREEKREERLE